MNKRIMFRNVPRKVINLEGVEQIGEVAAKIGGSEVMTVTN